jgi:hypothetical protein
MKASPNNRLLPAITLALVFSGAALAPVTVSGQLEKCPQLAERQGAENVWFGHRSGWAGDTYVWSETGCFATETECRKWLFRFDHTRKTTSVLSCRRGAPRWATR